MQRQENIYRQLIKETRVWARGRQKGPGRASGLRHEAILNNHAYYMDNVPCYRKLALEEGLSKEVDLSTIKSSLMLEAGIFKSYDQKWLDNGDYTRMTQWLSDIYHRRIHVDMAGVAAIDEWIDRLDKNGIYVVYSSGTSGNFSFVPRQKKNRALSRTVNIAGLSPQLASRIGSGFAGALLRMSAAFVPPEGVMKFATRKGLGGYDGCFLTFRGGRMGNQSLIEELAPMFSQHYFLYTMDITGSALRSLRRGAKNEVERQLVEDLKREVLERKEENYRCIIENMQASTDAGKKVFVFGAPYQFKELCEILESMNRCLDLKEGSLGLFGGGWKSFAGEAIEREVLVENISLKLGLSPEMILEGYSMTEINVLTLRCSRGRFHIPPSIEPVLLDEELNVKDGLEGEGTFGFLDALAVDYPGFIITGDHVKMVEGECGCSLSGPAVIQVGRKAGVELKGCGGIMGSMGV